MSKEYFGNIKKIAELEKALNDWFTVFKWDIDISSENLTSLSSLSKFTYSVEWYFWCKSNQLTTLEWFPKSVKWSVCCNHNNLISLEWCPRYIWWNFRCNNNNLKTLEWIPQLLSHRDVIITCDNNNFIPLEKKKWNVFKLGESIYIGNPELKDIQNLTKINLWWKEEIRDKRIELSEIYYNSFINFTKSTIKLNKQDITETDIIFKWKKFKKKALNL
jgi:hypothetical protein